MKTFSKILSEVAQPNSEDELNFKEKHVIDPIDYTVAPESTFSGNVDKDDIDGMKRYRKNKRLADYQRPEDEEVYEGVTLKRDITGQEDNDVDNDGDTDMADAQYKYRRHAQIKQHKIDEQIFVIPEEILATEKNAFHTAAANAHAAGKNLVERNILLQCQKLLQRLLQEKARWMKKFLNHMQLEWHRL